MAEQESAEGRGWVVAGSKESLDTVNPINQFMEVHFVDPISKCKKELIPLGKGRQSPLVLRVSHRHLAG